MQKLVLNVPLIRKADPYRTHEVVVEKVIRLPAREFDLLQNHPLQDNPVIQCNIPYMWMDSKQAHCVLFLDTDSGDGILVDSEGSQYARYSQYIPNARDMVNAHELSGAEWNLHEAVLEIAKRISRLAHKGVDTVDVETMLSEIGCDPTELLTTAVITALQDREDIRWAAHQTDTVVHVEAKPTERLTLYCPVYFQIYTPNPRPITPERACLAQTELQTYVSDIMKSYGSDRGYMEAHTEQDDNLLCRIGSMYEHGLGTEKDAVKALEYYHRSAETGNDRAAYLLGRMLLFGADGIEPDREQALYWLSVSAENGNPYAESILNNMEKYESEMLADTVFSLFVNLGSVIEDDYNNRQRMLHSQVDRKLRRMIQRQKEAIGLKSDGQQYQ